jgi:helix-turn-helix protein
MADEASGSQSGLTKGARITGDQRSTLGTAFGERYAGGESIRSIAQDTGRSYGFVHGVLKESGATLRGRGGATRGPRRGAADKLDAQVVASGGQTTASPERTKAKATRDKQAGEKKPAGKLVDKVVDKVSEKAGKAKGAVKDDKAKKKAEPKKAGKKGKKG